MMSRRWFILGLLVSCGIALTAVPVFSDTTTTEANISASVGAGCGNGVAEGAESCDGSDLNGESCGSQPGYVSGTLTCSVSCTLDLSACVEVTPTGCTGDCASPVISDLVITPSDTTASATWTATDDVAIDTCTFVYSVDLSYGSSADVSGSYTASLSGLTAETVYNYSLTCSDTAAKTRNTTGTFLTTAEVADTFGPIVSITTVTPSSTSCLIDWTATDSSGVDSCTILYGLGETYTISGDVEGSYTSTIAPLLPGLSYGAQVTCTDTLGNSTSEVITCETTPDDVPPPPITDLVITPGNTLNNLAWTYSDSLSDFASYLIRYSTLECPASPADGVGALDTIHNITTTNALQNGLINDTTYFYSVFVYDTSANTSVGVCGSGTPFGGGGPDSEICTDGIDNDLDGFIDCSDSDCTLHPSCSTGTEICTDGIDNDGDTDIDCNDLDCAEHVSCEDSPPDGEICTDGIDNDGDADIDCDDTDCSAHPSCTGGEGEPEICTDGIDNDLDGFIDCADNDCSSAPNCRSGPTGGTELICNDGIDNDGDSHIDCADTDCSEQPACVVDIAACNDGFDNDDDGLVDLLDPGCESIDDLDEYNAPDVVIIGETTIQPEDVTVYLAERTISYPLIDEGDVSTLTGDQLSLKVTPPETAVLDLQKITLHVGKQTIPFSLNAVETSWFADMVVPIVGTYDAQIEFVYTTGDISVLSFSLHSLPYGFVESDAQALEGVVVQLLRVDSSLFPADIYRQLNPQTTQVNGVYGYVVPNAVYQLVLSKDNYRVRTSRTFTVRNNVINQNFVLLKIPETPIETVAFIGGIIKEGASDLFGEVDDIADDPTVEQVTKTIVAPAVVGISAVVTIPSLWSILFPLLRFLFLQPILIFSKKRRKQYGIVYNSLTKTPLDLVVVRLLDFETNKVAQSHVTNKKGQYLFIPEVGTYKIEISKEGFLFPSKFLLGQDTDGNLVDIYHGEMITVTEDGAYVAPNIPIDPVVVDKTPRRLYLQKIGFVLQHTMAVLGIIITIVSLYISPIWYLWVFLGIHIVLYILFLRYTKPKKPKGWGIVYNTKDKKPLGRVVARLFSKEYNKLVATELTDSKGHYAFLAGANDYYVTFEKEGFEEKTKEISIKEEGIISNNIPLDPKA